MARVTPQQMDFSSMNFVFLFQGAPGVGKSTLAQGADKVITADFDNGMVRVKPEHRKDASISATYEEFLEDVEGAIKDGYKTIIIDTCGALIDMLKDWAMRTDPKASKKDGGFSLQGYGIVKSEFLRLSNHLKKHFNVVYLFHETKTKDGDDVFYDIVVEGSAKTLVYQPASLAARMFVMNGKRYLGFTPTAQYNAKSAFGISGVIEVPELKAGDSNDFLQKLFNTVRDNLKKEQESLNPQIDDCKRAVAEGMKIVEAVEKPEDVSPALAKIKEIKHALTSQKEVEAALKKRLSELGITYNKSSKSYEYKSK